MEVDLKEVKEWINSKKDGEIVGVSATGGDCPIARYLNEIHPLQDEWWMVGAARVWRKGAGSVDYAYLSSACIDFVSKVDNYPQDKIITKEDALKILSEMGY